MTDEELSNKLLNLVIAPSLVDISKVSVARTSLDGVNSAFSTITDEGNGKLWGEIDTWSKNNKNCICVCCPESVLDNIGSLFDSLPTNPDVSTYSRIVCKPLKYKSRKKNLSIHRKFAMREPLLRTLQTCLHIQNNLRQRKPLNDFNSGRCLDSCSRKITDFRELRNECYSILKEGAGVNCSSSHSYNGTCRNSEKETTTHDFKWRFIKTCSQQAALSSPSSHSRVMKEGFIKASADDVTIDELASYFDTLVHIPKKMSSMAEMMYI